MKTKNHVQARLKKGDTEMIAWIPKECAIEGEIIDLDDPEHGKETGWQVLSVGETILASKWVNERSRDHLNHRKMTDI